MDGGAILTQAQYDGEPLFSLLIFNGKLGIFFQVEFEDENVRIVSMAYFKCHTGSNDS